MEPRMSGQYCSRLVELAYKITTGWVRIDVSLLESESEEAAARDKFERMTTGWVSAARANASKAES
jgi:hypothetical protein